MEFFGLHHISMQRSGQQMGVLLNFKYSYSGIGSRNFDSPEIVIPNIGDDPYEQNDNFSSAYSLPPNIAVGSLICADDDGIVL